MSYVNQIKDKDAALHDIHDKRLEVTAADVGKVVSVDENGDIVLVNGGTKLYQHHVQIRFYGPNKKYLIAHILIVGNFSDAFTDIDDNDNTLTGGKPMKNITNIEYVAGIENLIMLTNFVAGNLLRPFDRNPQMNIYFLDDSDNTWKKGTELSFMSDEVTPL